MNEDYDTIEINNGLVTTIVINDCVIPVDDVSLVKRDLKERGYQCIVSNTEEFGLQQVWSRRGKND